MGNKMKGPYKNMCVKGSSDNDGPSDDFRDGSDARFTRKRSVKNIGYSGSESSR